MAGTASVVVCEVATTLRYHVEDSASAANPGNLFLLIVPSVRSSGHNGASSRTIHKTLTSLGAIRNSESAGSTFLALTSMTVTAGGQITEFADKAKTTATTSASGDIIVNHERIVSCR